ncbi:phosphate-starvation-inducible PsiE family protein [Sulfurihydrogenibium sp.]|uniref:phosphate-starvation-inducible PsiE family protein n=1 Tax=Sulfurihydrogenibium sp. TaxID=2053621 RepID=UPI002629F31E|nr:phosphate-starvation-inducible PsiE family protein [Sulfurihydrogenibium sp.]
MSLIKRILEPHKLHQKLGDLFEFFEDLIIVILTIILFVLSLMALFDLGQATFSHKYSFMDLIPKFLYVFILAELFRLNIVYLTQRIIDTSLIVKTTLIAILREVIIKAPGLKFHDYLGLSILLGVLALIYYVPKFMKEKEKNIKFRVRSRKSGKRISSQNLEQT